MRKRLLVALAVAALTAACGGDGSVFGASTTAVTTATTTAPTTTAATTTTPSVTTSTTEVVTTTALPEPTGLPVGTPYSGYELVTDDSGALEVSVPVEWSDHLTDGWDFFGDGSVMAAAITAAPDVEAWFGGWDVPGVFVSASSGFGMTVDEMLDWDDFSDECTYVGRDDYDDGEYVGKVDFYRACGGVGSELYVIAAESYAGGVLVLVEAVAVTQSDYDALTEISSTFRVTGTP
jgi:hypothetical protein